MGPRNGVDARRRASGPCGSERTPHEDGVSHNDLIPHHAIDLSRRQRVGRYRRGVDWGVRGGVGRRTLWTRDQSATDDCDDREERNKSGARKTRGQGEAHCYLRCD